MDLKQLRALVTVADTGNVTRASALLNLVQPAVSRQLKLLEQDIGTPLFERERHGMELTAAGRTLVEYARRILDDVAKARAEIRPASGEVGGIVSIGLLSSTAELLAGALVAQVAQHYPGIRLRLQVGYVGHLMRLMEADELDATLLYGLKQASHLQVRPLLQEDLWVIGPASARLQRRRPMTMKQLASRAIVLPSAPHGLRTLIEEGATRAGVQLRTVVETNEMNVQKQLVREGHGFTIMPLIAVAHDLRSGLLSAAPLVEPEVTRTVVLAAPRSRTPTLPVRCVVNALVDCIEAALRSGRWPSAQPLRTTA